MQLHTFTILVPQQYSERQFTCAVTENGILLLFQQLIEKNYLKNFPVCDRRFVAEPWLTHILISKVRGVKCKEKHLIPYSFLFIKEKEITLVGIGYFYSWMKTSL